MKAFGGKRLSFKNFRVHFLYFLPPKAEMAYFEDMDKHSVPQK
jgi:hypothetical protein